jgi:hypothetical protein
VYILDSPSPRYTVLVKVLWEKILKMEKIRKKEEGRKGGKKKNNEER